MPFLEYHRAKHNTYEALMTKFTPICLQSLLLLFALLSGCSADDKDDLPVVIPGSEDGTPGPKIPEGFNVLTPNYLGFKVKTTDDTLEAFVDKQCVGQTAGTFFSMGSYSEKQDLHFCLDLFARPEQKTFETICLDCKDKINITNAYVGVVTDKSSKGVADISVITIIETADLIRTRCQASTFGDTMRASYGNNSISKAVQEQLLSLQLDDGVCSSVKLENFQDLTSVTMSDWHYDTNLERVARFALTRVDLQSRSSAE